MQHTAYLKPCLFSKAGISCRSVFDKNVDYMVIVIWQSSVQALRHLKLQKMPNCLEQELSKKCLPNDCQGRQKRVSVDNVRDIIFSAIYFPMRT